MDICPLITLAARHLIVIVVLGFLLLSQILGHNHIRITLVNTTQLNPQETRLKIVKAVLHLWLFA